MPGYLRAALAAAAADARQEASGGEVYGRPLADFDTPPAVVLECMGFLDAHGLYVPGLFRVPGSSDTVSELKRRFDAGDQLEFSESQHNVHDVAALLKMFFR
jgi:RhoGAP domain